MRHRRRKQDIHYPIGRGSADPSPFIQIPLLRHEFALVQLPVFVDGYGMALVNEILDVWEEWLARGHDVVADILAAVDGVEGIHDVDAFLVAVCVPGDDFVAGGLELGG